MSTPNPIIVPTVMNSKTEKGDVKKLVNKLESLPTLPAMATKILTMFAHTEPEVDEIIKVIKSDQTLAMKILKLVNSSYYSISNHVTSIESAVMLLGFNEARAALLSVTVSESLITSLTASCAREQAGLWKHALASAVCAEMIAAQTYPAFKGELFLCGLLHDVGKLVLQECFPEQMDRISDENSRQGTPSFEVENNAIGVDHTIVGKWIAEKWALPEIFLQAIWLHHHPLEILLDLDFIKQKKMVAITRLANMFSHRIMADTLTFNHGHEDFDDLVAYLNLNERFTKKLACSLGKYYSEWASILDLEEDELSFYYQALQRANEKMAGLLSENARHNSLRKTNEELRLLHDLHLKLTALDTVEQVIAKAAHAAWLNLREPQGVLYYYNRAGECLVGSAWNTHRDPKPFTVTVDCDGKPLLSQSDGFGDGVTRLLMTRLERPQTINVKTSDLTVAQYSKPYLVIPFVSNGLCIGEMAFSDDILQGHDPRTSEKLKTISYLASITESALTRVAMVEEAKGTAETLSSTLAKNHQMVLLLKKTNEEFKNLFDYSNDAVILHRVDGKVTRINQRAEELLGYSREELKSSNMLQGLFSVIREQFSAAAAPHQDAAIGLVFETELQHRDGTPVDVEVSSRIADPLTGLMQSLIRDVTRRKKTAKALRTEKERLAVTLRSIGDGVITTDTDGTIVMINPVGEQLTGWSQEKATGASIEAVLTTVDEKSRCPLGNPIKNVLKNGKIVEYSRPTILVANDGSTRPIAHTAAPIIDRDNTIIGGVVVFRDVTEKLAMEQELIKSQKFESLGVLASGIAHDFNNILTAINGSITLAKMYTKKGEKTFEKLLQAEKATQRAKDLTRQLSTFSKGGLPEKKTSSIAEIVTESVGFVLRGSNVRCTCTLPEDLWHAHVDAGQISQVLNNLIINADQAMEDGGAITVSAQNYVVGDKNTIPLKSGNYVAVRVQDEGCGIPAENMAKIFDPYFTTKESGNGLGLATAYAIIKKHDGYIHVESTVEKGTTFSLYIPAFSGKAAVTTSSSDNPVKGKGHILLMDDEEGIRETTGEMLESIGYDVAFAKDGLEAIERYKNAQQSSSTFDAVIIDLTIPGSMGGEETIQELHKIDPHVKAIISSGYAADPVMADFENYGFKDFITKPYQIGILSRILHAVTTRKP